MRDLIDRQEAIDALDCINGVEEVLRSLPPAQPHTYRGVTLNDVMMYFDSLEGNEDAWTEFCSCLECRGWGLYHIRSATDKNVGITISRQQAIDAVTDELDIIDHVPQWVFDRLEGRLKQLPPAQPEPHYDEWCDSCKEYDKEKHSCPRWNKVIRQTLADMQSEMCEDAVSRKAVIDTIDEWKEACAGSGHKETVSDIKLIRKDFIDLPPVTPKQRTGKWIDGIIPNDGGGLPVIVCDQCNTFFPLQFGDGHNFCPNCGAKMVWVVE